MMTGAGKFFINLSFALCGTFRGGAAKVCIFASGLLGMMSGSIVSNVLTAGTMTIPVMKAHRISRLVCRRDRSLRVHRRGARAAGDGRDRVRHRAVPECQLRRVALAAIIPALLYYVGLFMQVDAYAARHGLKGCRAAKLPTPADTFAKAGTTSS
jgi:TRAP-type uncharacterized transport system fused permease subunit